MRTSTSAPQPLSTTSHDECESPDVEHDEAPDAQRSSRRSFFFLGAMAAATLLPGTAKAQSRRVRRPAKPSQPSAAPTNPFHTIEPNERPAAFTEWQTSAAPISRLVRRVTMGVTAADMAKATQLGWQGYLNYQLNYTRINDDAVENTVSSKWPLLSQTPDQLV
ncbi:MAG TPA: hypothetical protein VIP11_23200, partial [Gemmatimonadaceae bacterium]